MKTTIKLLAIATLLFTSCSKNIEVCIDGNMTPEETGTYTYTWCGQNADQIFWTINNPNGNNNTVITEEGEGPLEATFDFKEKGRYTLQIESKNKKKDAFMSYTIDVGNFETRIEPQFCGGSTYFMDNATSTYKAYAYSNISNFQTDLRNNNKANCIDSISLDANLYYDRQLHESFEEKAYVGGFKNLADGDYIFFVQEKGTYNYNNLAELGYYPLISNINSANDYYGYDVVYNPKLTSLGGNYLMNLYSKDYLLTDVLVDGSSVGVSTCNADDKLFINIDGTWTYDIGLDDCSGGQVTSEGTYSGFSGCGSNPVSATLSLNANSGSMLGTIYYMTNVSSTQIKLTSTSGSNTIVQIFTIQ